MASGHPFGRWPHEPRQELGPGYVGPSWAAPGPYRPLPPPPRRKQKGGWGCCLAILVGSLGGISALLALVLMLVSAIGGGAEPDSEPVTPPTDPTQPPGPTPPPKAAEEPEVWVTGVCREVSRERNKLQYDASRGNGSARRLRGKVSLLHVRLESTQSKWSKDAELRVEQAAMLQQRFYLKHAQRYGVTDLALEVVPWALKTPVHIGALQPGPDNRLDDATVQQLRNEAKRAIETALGERLDRVVARLQRDGFDEVALVVYLPITTKAREFAWSGFKNTPHTYPEVAYMFSPLREFGDFAVTVSHEGLHLFGADDLYRMRSIDETDKHDIMGEACTGFREATVGDATAYAIGWLPSAPRRPYPIVDR